MCKSIVWRKLNQYRDFALWVQQTQNCEKCLWKEWLFFTNPRLRTSPRNMSIDMVIWKFQQGDNLASRIILNEVPYAIIIRMINLQLLTIRMCIWFFFIFIFWLIGFQMVFYLKLIVIDIERRLWANLLCNIGSELVKTTGISSIWHKSLPGFRFGI